MKKTILFLLLTLVVMGAYAKEVSGINFPDTKTFAEQETPLVLNGAGLRKKAFIKIYSLGLYLPEKSTDADAILTADEPMAMRLVMMSGIVTPKMFIETTYEAFNEATNGNTEPIKAEIEEFVSVFKAGIAKGDVYEIVYTPGKGIEVFKNGATESPVCIKGMPIKTATFGNWVGVRSEKALMDLRDELLGK